MGTVPVLVIAGVLGGVTIAALAAYRTATRRAGEAAEGSETGGPPRAATDSQATGTVGSRAKEPGSPRAGATAGSQPEVPGGPQPGAPADSRPVAAGDPQTGMPVDSRPAAAAGTQTSVPVDSRPTAATPSGPAGDAELEFTLDIPEKTPARAPPSPAGRSPVSAAGRAPVSAAAHTTEADREALSPPEVLARLFELALGKGRPASTVTAGHEDVAEAVGAVLEDIASQDRYAPRRPDMLPKILSASNNETFSQRELAALLARDPSLVGNLLKIANSSYYRVTPEPVESVERAVVLLGTDGIRSLVTTSLMQPIFRIGGADFPRFPEIAWEHTFRSASATVPYNFLMEQSDPFAAELLSLVMGLAEIVIFRVTLDQYARYPRLRPDGAVVAALLDKHSATVARRIGASWELSEPTLAGLDGHTAATTSYPTALGRSLYFGRVVGALAVLRIKHVIDDAIGKASLPPTTIPEAQIERMWTRLTTS